jgi:uncharacterized protein YukE
MRIVYNDAEFETVGRAFSDVGENLQNEINSLADILMGGCGVEGESRKQLYNNGSKIKQNMGAYGTRFKNISRVLMGYAQSVNDVDAGLSQPPRPRIESAVKATDAVCDTGAQKQIGVDFSALDSDRDKIAQIAERCRAFKPMLEGHIKYSQGSVADFCAEIIRTAQNSCEVVAVSCDRAINDLNKIRENYEKHESSLKRTFT